MRGAMGARMMAMSHEMIQIDGVWECVSCPRRLVFGADRLPMVLERGDTDVQHFGTIGDAPRLTFRRS
jgi:hypothetical protein